eukprot:gene15711-21823_t
MPTNDQDELISRLVNKIAELEEKLYKQDLDAPAGVMEPVPPQSKQAQHDLGPGAAEGGFFSLFKESLRLKMESIASLQQGNSEPLSLSAPPASSPPVAPPATDWFSGLFKKGQDGVPQSNGSAQGMQSDLGKSSSDHGSPAMSIVDGMSDAGRETPLPLQMAENPAYLSSYMWRLEEVNQGKKRAAAEALMEAEAKLAAAEEAGRQMQQQLEQYQELAGEVDRLKYEKDVALRLRQEVENECVSVVERRMSRGHHQSLQEDLGRAFGARQLSWQGGSLDERLNVLTTAKAKLTESEAERQRLSRDLDDAGSKLQWLQKINSQLETSAQQLEGVRKQCSDYQEKFMKERNVRRKLHEQLQVLKGNIRVMCRVRLMRRVPEEASPLPPA